MSSNLIPILSLFVAAAAVVVGPLVSWSIACRGTRATLAVANKQIVGPMRQAWINATRDIMAELVSKTLHYYVAGFEERADEEYQQLTLLEYRLLMMLNAKETDHILLASHVRKLISGLDKPNGAVDTFPADHAKVVALSREILKTEWNRVREGIEARTQ